MRVSSAQMNKFKTTITTGLKRHSLRLSQLSVSLRRVHLMTPAHPNAALAETVPRQAPLRRSPGRGTSGMCPPSPAPGAGTPCTPAPITEAGGPQSSNKPSRPQVWQLVPKGCALFGLCKSTLPAWTCSQWGGSPVQVSEP